MSVLNPLVLLTYVDLKDKNRIQKTHEKQRWKTCSKIRDKKFSKNTNTFG